MGGYGSGRKDWVRHVPRREDCIGFSTRDLRVWGLMQDQQRAKTVSWTLANGQVTDLIILRVDLVNPEGQPRMRMEVQKINGHCVRTPITIRMATTSVLGGKAVLYHFLCPRCGTQVKKLWLHPDRDEWGCRHCLRLRYEVSLESHLSRSYRRALNQMAGGKVTCNGRTGA